jgi:hypothetical protein
MLPPPAKGLVVRAPWAGLIVDGKKTWELRGSATAHRGRTGIILSGAGTVVGEAELVDVIGPLSPGKLAETKAFHRVNDVLSSPVKYRSVYAWVFDEARRYDIPVPYNHPKGAVIWVKLKNADRGL